MIKLFGIGISPGIAIGKAYIYIKQENIVPCYRINNTEKEIERFHKGIEEAKKELSRIKEKSSSLSKSYADIFIAHIMLLDDVELRGEIEHKIKEEQKNAECIIKQVSDRLVNEFLSVDKNRRQSEVELLRKFIGYAAKSPNSIPDNIKYDVIEILKEIAKDKPIIYKRDPVENRDSYISAYVRVDDTGYSMKTNPFDLCRNGGDHDGDAVSVFALLTEDSINQAKKELNPLHSKTVWYRGDSPNISISFTLDSSTAIYAATKK